MLYLLGRSIYYNMARVFEIVAAGVGILGILSIIDVIRNWIGG
jgi:hypothetical protein